MTPKINQENYDKFQKALAAHYLHLFANDSDYAYAAQRNTAEGLAEKMTRGLFSGSANKEGKAIKAACKDLNIDHTYKAIQAFLTAS